jgi:hypothetical protein
VTVVLAVKGSGINMPPKMVKTEPKPANRVVVMVVKEETVGLGDNQGKMVLPVAVVIQGKMENLEVSL